MNERMGLFAGSLLIGLLFLGAVSVAQPPNPPMRHPLMVALDANGDGEISAEELANAPAALKALDRNADGKLTLDEILPQPGDRQQTPGDPGPPSPQVEQRVMQWMELDDDGDGKLSKDEVPAEMQGMIDRADTDDDGFASREELLRFAQTRFAGRGDGNPRRGQAFRGDDLRPGGGRDDERPGGFGAGDFVDRMFQFDTDNDGKLSREELQQMVERGGAFGGRRDDGRQRRPNRPQ